MPFDNNQPEAINQMIEFGTKLIDSNIKFDLYVNEMIKNFFPEANIDIVKIMLEWAKYPTLRMITLDNLKEIEINERTTKFKKQVKNTIVSQDQYNKFNAIIENIKGSHVFGNANNSKLQNYKEIKCWNDIFDTISLYERFPSYIGFSYDNQTFANAENIISYVNFTEIIKSIWISNINHIQSKNDKFEQFVEKFDKEVESLTSKINDLERENELQSEGCAIDCYNNKLINDKFEDSLHKMRIDQHDFREEVQLLKCHIVNLINKLNKECVISCNNKFEQSLEKLTTVNDDLREQVQLLTFQIKNLEDKNQFLQDQIVSDTRKINLIQSKLGEFERKYTPELISYDYNVIKARLDPIRSELKMAQRIFAKIIHKNY